MKITILALVSVLAISSTAAFAADAKPDIMTSEQPETHSIFEKLDENKDGKVSPQEAQVSPALVKGFDKIDSNKDGFLSPDEFSQLQVNAAPTHTYVAMASPKAL